MDSVYKFPKVEVESETVQKCVQESLAETCGLWFSTVHHTVQQGNKPVFQNPHEI